MSNDKEAFERAMGFSPVVAEDKKESKSDLSAFNRAMEERAVVLANNPVDEGPTAFDRIFTEPGQRFIERGQAIVGRVEESAQDFFIPSLEPIKTEEPTRGTDLPSVLLQTLGNPISLAFDVGANAITVGVEEAFALLPEETQKNALDFLNSAMQTKTGQLAMSALAEGAESWDEYSEMYPNEAANFTSFFEIQFGLPKILLPNYSPDLRPAKISTIGTRKTTAPLKGIDKDIYNIAYSNKKKSIEQAKLTTDPRGPLRTQEQLATEEQLQVVDELKKAGVSGNRTLQENLNKTTEYLDKIDRGLFAIARRRKQPISMDVFNEILKTEFRNVRANNSSVFADKAASKKFNKFYSQMLAEIKNNGNTPEGLLNARRSFDDKMRRMGVKVGSSDLNAANLSAKTLRNAVNKTLFDRVPEAQEFLKRESRVLSVQDNIAAKAAEEAQGAIGRYIQELGLDKLTGETATSRIINAGAVLGLSIGASPYVILKRMMKKPTPAKVRSKVGYVLNDVFKEIEKGLKRTQDPKTKKSLLLQKPIVYSAFKAAAEQIIAEAEEAQEAENEQLVR